ncbi:MAG: DUF5362 family protein [bacterium]|nr:DUF5362 family protein [bacterium]
MESTETLNIETSSFFKNEERNAYLREMAKWGKLLSIVGFIGMGIICIIAVAMMAGMSFFSKNTSLGGLNTWIGLVYIAMAALYYFPVKYLFTFSKEINLALDLQDENNLTEGLKNLKSVFKFMGIATMIMLVVYGLVFVFGLLAYSMR